MCTNLFCLKTKIGLISRPAIAIRQKLANNKVLMARDWPQGRVRSINFTTSLLLGLGLDLVLIALSKNIVWGPRLAKVCLKLSND